MRLSACHTAKRMHRVGVADSEKWPWPWSTPAFCATQVHTVQVHTYRDQGASLGPGMCGPGRCGPGSRRRRVWTWTLDPNSPQVSIYQLFKIATTPTLCILQFALYNMRLSRMQLLALVPVCVGVGIAQVGCASSNSCCIRHMHVGRQQD